MKNIGTILLGGFGLLVVVVVVVVVGGGTMKGLAHDKAAYQAYVTLFSASEQDIPATVEIVTKEGRTVFKKGTPPYDRLRQILRHGRDQSAIDQAGPSPDWGEKFQFGELVLHRDGLPIRLKIYRALGNGNYFWIAVPHADGSGTHYPLFALDPDFVNLTAPAPAKAVTP
jgi:hypothetical protein